ncbi:hypothetical protein [Paenibacillus popilliae]|uniref:hypothetical protein n=1 Tax=Paenibacillus popilliae TaxID=78057 RepID=UPI0005AB8EA4|nr:hypothetical protein [Paenibacillus popilliae]
MLIVSMGVWKCKCRCALVEIHLARSLGVCSLSLCKVIDVRRKLSHALFANANYTFMTSCITEIGEAVRPLDLLTMDLSGEVCRQHGQLADSMYS